MYGWRAFQHWLLPLSLSLSFSFWRGVMDERIAIPSVRWVLYWDLYPNMRYSNRWLILPNVIVAVYVPVIAKHRVSIQKLMKLIIVVVWLVWIALESVSMEPLNTLDGNLKTKLLQVKIWKQRLSLPNRLIMPAVASFRHQQSLRQLLSWKHRKRKWTAG